MTAPEARPAADLLVEVDSMELPGLKVGRFLGVPLVLPRGSAGALAAAALGTALVSGPGTAPPVTAGLAGLLLTRDLTRVVVGVSMGRFPVYAPVCRPLASFLWRAHTPREECLLALAGAGGLLAATGVAALGAAGTDGSVHRVLSLLVVAGLVLAVVNLLPGLPADGGRLVRALAWRTTGSRVAGTRVARRAGRITGVLVALLTLSALTSGDPVATAITLATGLPLAVLLWRGAARSGGPGRPGGRPRPADVALTLCLAVAATALLRAYVVRTFSVSSSSMQATLQVGDHVLADRVTYRLREVRRGDLVVLRRPANAATTEADLVKRVVGLPGERITARNGTVWINGMPMLEPYANTDCPAARKEVVPLVIPAGHLYVLGDDRCRSLDSREFGPVDTRLVEGRLLGIVWPLGRTGRF